jgi:hypothetical protein
MPSGAIFGGGCTLKRITTAIAEVKGVRGPSLQAATTETTSFDSANDVREFLSTLKDGGTVSFSINYIPNAGGTAHQLLVSDMLSGTNQSWKLDFPNSISMSFTGIVTGFEISAELEQAVGANVTIKLTGWPTWA